MLGEGKSINVNNLHIFLLNPDARGVASAIIKKMTDLER